MDALYFSYLNNFYAYLEYVKKDEDLDYLINYNHKSV